MLIVKNGFQLRALQCPKCQEKIVHPSDLEEYKKFSELKNKQFDVKLRMVGNSYAVSIPREIVDFMHEQEDMVDSMVRLCFQDAKRLSLMFGDEENQEKNENSRVIKSREVKVIKNNKPVLHAKQFYDSAHPERSQSKIFKANKLEEEE
jgi:NhaP-type Na+/H+ and K+/H+ antiporter